MISLAHRSAGTVLALALLTPSWAQGEDAAAAEPKNEIVVFGGAAILDASRTFERTLALPSFPGLPNWPGAPGRWQGFPDVQVRAETSIGTSVLFGARYSRVLKDRLAVEADFGVAPTHELEVEGGLCVGGTCVGRDRQGRFAGRDLPSLAFDDGPERDLTAWHYGAGLAYELAGGDVRPLLIAGAGGVSWSGARESETNFVVRFGAGLKILFGRVGARVDVVDHLVIDHFLTGDAEHDIHTTAGLLVRF